MTMRKRDAKLLLILLGVAILLIGYFAVYVPYTSLADDVTAQTEALKPRLNQLRGYYENLSSYRNETARIKEDITAEMERYPSDVRPEDLIMYADNLRQNYGLNINSITFGEPSSMLQLKGIGQKGNGTGLISMTAYRRTMTITCGISYQKLKDMLTYMNSTDRKTTLDSLTISYDSDTGELSGRAVLAQYFIASDNYAYSPTEVPQTALGKSNLFGSMTPDKKK